MKQTIAIILIGICVYATGIARESAFQVTLQVVDDEGSPVARAQSIVSYENERARKSSERINSSEGVTDADGQLRLAGKAYLSGLSYGAKKPGYYTAYGLRYHFKDTRQRRWQPWNPTIEVVLKRIKNPVPMYAKRVETPPYAERLGKLHPEFGQPVAYDFQIGDWVRPYGIGKTPDIIFLGTYDNRGDRDFDYDLKVTFSNSGDGIQRFTPDPEPSVFPSPYEAPEAGYLSEWNLHRSRHGPDEREHNTFDKKGAYFFRVRTELDKEGKVVKALYGKIYGEFFFMTYYLNPDGTRNMECDPNKNLLKPKVVTNFDRMIYNVGP